MKSCLDCTYCALVGLASGPVASCWHKMWPDISSNIHESLVAISVVADVCGKYQLWSEHFVSYVRKEVEQELYR